MTRKKAGQSQGEEDDFKKGWSMDLCITENVFYNKNITRTYDLKGSRSLAR